MGPSAARSDLDVGTVFRPDHDAAVAAPIEPAEPSTGCKTAGVNANFCDYVTMQLFHDPAFGEEEDRRLLNFRRGGYNVYTTLDRDLQNAAVATLTANVPKSYPGWDVGGVFTSVQVGTGRVLVMAQNKDMPMRSKTPRFDRPCLLAIR